MKTMLIAVAVLVLLWIAPIPLWTSNGWGSTLEQSSNREFSYDEMSVLQPGSKSQGSRNSYITSNERTTKEDRILPLDSAGVPSMQFPSRGSSIPHDERQDDLLAGKTGEEGGRGATLKVSEAGNRPSDGRRGSRLEHGATGQRHAPQGNWQNRGGRTHDRSYGGWGHRNDDILGGVVGGFLGGIAGSIFAPAPESPVVIIQPQAPAENPAPWSPEWFQYCSSRYRSFESESGTFTGYDGVKYFCK